MLRFFCNYFCFTIKSNCLWDIISAFVLPLNSMFAKNLLLLHTSKNWQVSIPKSLLELPDRHFYLSAQKTWHIRSKIHLLNLQLHQFFLKNLYIKNKKQNWLGMHEDLIRQCDRKTATMQLIPFSAETNCLSLAACMFMVSD